MKVLYFGPITAKGAPSIGGYEAANRKNIDALEKRGIEVVEFPNPKINKRFGNLGKLAYFKLFLTPFALFKYMGKKDVIVHATPLYGNILAYPVNLLYLIAKCLHIPVISDIRAGSFIYYWEHKGWMTRWSLKHLLIDSNHITVEGSSYISKFNDIVNHKCPISYFPNLADCKDLKFVEKDVSKINLFYFGRITLNKGIDIILETIHLLDSRFCLYMAGSIANDVDKSLLDNDDRVNYLGVLNASQLREVMKKMHIFIFPTHHIGEGQSNSLIEAMAEGLIPITSNQGFCAEVVADCGEVLKLDSTANDYKNAILKIASSDINKLSFKCQEHIIEAHNVDVEINNLIKIYQTL